MNATIALVGNPNVGKSTLFNHVTGSRQRTVNAPGTTVDLKAGTWKTLGHTVLDLPGTYSLVPRSPDEQVVTDTLAGRPWGSGAKQHGLSIPFSLTHSGTVRNPGASRDIDLVLAVLDGGSLARSLYLLAQLGQTGRPLAAVVTMADVAKADGVELDVARLAEATGIPVLAFDPRDSDGYGALDEMVSGALASPSRLRGIEPDPTAPGYPGAPVAAGRTVADSAFDAAGATRNDAPGTAEHSTGRPLVAARPTQDGTPGPAPAPAGHATGAPAVATPAAAPGPAPRPASAQAPGHAPGSTPGYAPATKAASLVSAALGTLTPSCACGCGGAHSSAPTLESPETDATARTDSMDDLSRSAALFAWVDGIEKTLAEGHKTPAPDRPSYSDRIDRVLLHPLWGSGVFLALMYLLFKTAGEWVGPIQDFFDGLFASTEPGTLSLAGGFQWALDRTGAGDSWLASLLVDGVATGLGVVASFFPLMFVIYLALTILEDSGYMARAAFLGDRIMRHIGLDGRVILPLIMGFGCNLPSLAAARTLPSQTQRLITVLVTPYTSCAARLTIYLMIAKIFFPNHAGLVVFAMYVASVVLITASAWILARFVGHGEKSQPLMLVLPAYQMPRIVHLLATTWRRAWSFVTGAGKIIVAMTLVVWLMGAIPVGASAIATGDGGTRQAGFADPELPMEESLYGRVAQAIEPIFIPAGFAEWHMMGALMTGFVAKETVVSSIVASYNLDPEAAGDAEEGGDDLGRLPELLHASFTKSAGDGYEGLAAVAFMLFVLAYTPCMATVAEQAKIIGGRRATIMVLVQFAVAGAMSVAVFQGGKLFL